MSDLQYRRTIDAAYNRIVNALGERLSREGYERVITNLYDKLLGSYYLIWASAKELIRFSWDDIEKMFVLEYDDSPTLTSTTSWFDIMLADYDPLVHDEGYLQIIIQEILDSLDI